MKTLAELQKLRDDTLKKMNVRISKNGRRIQVGMGTCGIAAGARKILNQFIEELDKNGIKDVTVTQVGCMGECAFEPIAEVIEPDGTNIIYCNLDKTKVNEIIESHLVNGKKLEKYSLHSVKK
ncbi:(2Fe-2S) ferredoxin domain-containing protein [Acholeplasma sp. OttesenSCG-928-E16]|nr:(2Fe-2S) ferredoxin domain-containing protein [Acholeplasma sp. OttesenSCG-928-E16]